MTFSTMVKEGSRRTVVDSMPEGCEWCDDGMGILDAETISLCVGIISNFIPSSKHQR